MQKSREGHGKNWRHFVYKLDNLFRSMRVSDENSSVTPAIQNFNNLLQLWTSFAFSMHHSKPRHQLSTLCDIICYFNAFTDLFWAKWPCNFKALQMNSEKVETWQGIIISPAEHVQKSREGHGKNWMHFMYKLDNLYFLAHAMWVKLWYHANFQPFLSSFEMLFNFRVI